MTLRNANHTHRGQVGFRVRLVPFSSLQVTLLIEDFAPLPNPSPVKSVLAEADLTAPLQ